MSAFAAAAQDEDGDTISALRAAIEQARTWIAEHPDRRPVSAGRMVAILTNALAAAPQPPVVKQPQGEQEPFTVLVRKRSWFKNTWEAAPCGFPDYGKAWADERINVYTHPQPPRQPLTDEQIGEIDGWFSNEYGL